jgi:hypothetical protein
LIAELLPPNKRLQEGTLSENSAAYSEARQRLPLAAVEFFAESVCRSLIDRTPPWQGERRAFLIDGTTITLPPTSELARVFPPATNQHGETVWPVLLLLVAHELQTGCALPPELGAMYGPDNVSEARLAAALMRRLPACSLLLGDAGFGIFQVAWNVAQAGHTFLLRLSKSRFKALRRSATLLEETPAGTTWALTWTPSVKDRSALPELPAQAALEVRLHATPLPSGERLLLVTSERAWSSAEAAEHYARRYDIEHDLRDFKVTLAVEKLRARSAAMVRKELLCSVVAYNLVQEFRRQAAALAQLPPRRLSFTKVWTTFTCYLLRQPPGDAATWQARYNRALKVAARDKLPHRPGRSYPRQAHPRRSKSTKFQKTKPPAQPPPTK